MSEWSTSLGYCAADRFPDSDEEGEAELAAPPEQAPATKGDDEESVQFTETPFTIAARLAQVRKARQPAVPVDRDTDPSEISFSRHDATPTEPTDRSRPPSDFNPRRYQETEKTSIEPTASSVPRHEIRRPTIESRAPSLPSEVIVVSSDSDDIEIVSTTCMDGSRDVGFQSNPHRTSNPRRETTGEQALQQLFDENQDFYESLDREMALREAQASSMSEPSSSSVRIESMVPDASTSYETSSWAPTRTTYSYEPYPVGGAYQASGPPQPAFQLDYVVPPLHAQTYAPIQHEAYGNASQYPAQYPLYLPMQTSDHIPAPVTAESSHSWRTSYQPPYEGAPAYYAPTPPHYTATSYQPQQTPYHHPHMHTQQPFYGPDTHPQLPLYAPVPAPSQIDTHQQASSSRARLESFVRTKSPRQAQEDKAKADLVCKALRGASKRSRTRTANPAAPSSSSQAKENEWSTLKASRPGRDGTLSLTAALRRPLPATRLQQASRGGSRLSLPLYRTVGSNAEARRRAETILSAHPAREQTQSSSTASTSKRPVEPSNKSKLFRPPPLTESDRNHQTR